MISSKLRDNHNSFMTSWFCVHILSNSYFHDKLNIFENTNLMAKNKASLPLKKEELIITEE